MKSFANLLSRGFCAAAVVMSVSASGMAQAATTYSIGGRVSGLGAGKSVTMKSSQDSVVVVSANGSFAYPKKQRRGSYYGSWVLVQPEGQRCVSSNNTGEVGRSNVTSIRVNCTDVAPPSFNVGGALSGLAAGKTVALQNNGGASLTLNASGAFNFSNAATTGSTYAVAVSTQPAGQTCSVSNGSGTMGSAHVTNVAVNCVTPPPSSFSVGGTVTGLTSGKSVVLQNNGGNNQTVNANGNFTFSTKLATAASFAVTVLTQPAGLTCSVSNGTGTINGANVANVAVSCTNSSTTAEKWHPGLYAKVEDWQMYKADKDNPEIETYNTQEMEEVYDELETTPQLRGIKVMVRWSRHESVNTATGAITRDFSKLKEILDRLAQISAKTKANGTDPHGKYLILGISWRSFKEGNGAITLPNDMRTGRMWNANPDWAHMRYDYLWAYKSSMNPKADYSYNLKLWDTQVLSRMNDFIAAMATQLDSHPNLTQVSTTESALGQPVIPFVEGEGMQQQFDGQLAVIRMMRKSFTKSLVVPDLNFSQEHVARMAALLEKEGLGLGTSNINKSNGLNRTTPVSAPGVLTYFPKLSNKVALAPEIQGLDLRDYGDGTSGRPGYEYLYSRARNDLNANYIVIQRTFPYWKGDSATPSLLSFIRTHSAIKNDVTGAGGLNTTKPSGLYPAAK